jgi:hypothetical protein
VIFAEAPMADIDGAVIALLLALALGVLAVTVAALAAVSVAGIYTGRALVGRTGGVRPSVGAVALCTGVAFVAGIGAASIDVVLALSAAFVAFVLGAALGAYLPMRKAAGAVRDGA